MDKENKENKLEKVIAVLVFIVICMMPINGYCKEYLMKTQDGQYKYLRDYYITTLAQDKRLDDYIKRWCKNNNPPTQLSTYFRIRNHISRVTTYDNDGMQCYSAYGALFNRRAVCMGYSLLAKKFFDAKGIENELIYVPAYNHMYNRVRLDGIWQDADITWYDVELEKLIKLKGGE